MEQETNIEVKNSKYSTKDKNINLKGSLYAVILPYFKRGKDALLDK